MKRVFLMAAAVAFLALGGLAACADTTTTTAAMPTGTITTSAPGEMTFVTLVERFERLADHESLAGTLPHSVLSKEELAWLFDAAMPFAVTDAQGYRFANGDLVVLFFLTPPPGGPEAETAAAKTFAQIAYARFGKDHDVVWPSADDHYGFVVVSKQYREDLGRLAQWARSAYPELIPE